MATSSPDRDAFEAVDAGDAARLRELLGREPAAASARDGEGVSLLLRAQYAMRDDLVAAVRDAGPELDAHEAAAVGDSDRLRELTGADPALVRAVAPDGFAPLHLAAFFRRPHVVRLLLDRGADPNATAANATAVTPLHSAAAGGDRDCVRAIVEAGADLNARQRGGYVPLHAVAAAGDTELVELLLANDADAKVAADDGTTPASIARSRGHADVAERLGG